MRKLVLLLPLAVGCAKTDSSDLLTSGIYAGMTAQATGNGSTTVGVSLYVGNPINLNFVDLTGDDQLIASHGAEEKVMSELELLNVVSHTATFSTDSEGDEFEVAFVRTVDDGAPSSLMTLPAKFDLDPPPSATQSRTEALTLTWNGPQTSDTMRWEVRGDCIELETQTLTADTGSLTIEAGRVKKRMGDGIVDSCPMTVTVTRARPGELDPGYGKGGNLEGTQVRQVQLTSTP